MAGLYIMSNTGQLSDMKFSINGISVTKGQLFTKIYLASTLNDIIITIKNT
jgi:hypothetical protein